MRVLVITAALVLAGCADLTIEREDAEGITIRGQVDRNERPAMLQRLNRMGADHCNKFGKIAKEADSKGTHYYAYQVNFYRFRVKYNCS